MRISLNSPVRKTAFVGGSAALLIVMWGVSAQSFLGWWFSRTNTLEGYQRAARIDPGNADHFLALGLATQSIDYAIATSHLERAVQSNPHSARAWLALASAYSLTQQPQKQRQAILSALAAAPKDVDVDWEAANLFLLEGDDRTGLALMRDVVAGDESRARAAMQVAFNVSDRNVQKTISALPPTAHARLELMRWLLDHDHAPESDQVWPTVASAGDNFASRDALFYVDSLIVRKEVARARTVWSELSARDQELSRRSESGSVIVNGDFEDNLLNSGFDWRWTKLVGVTATIDTTVFHAGTRSLSLQFDAQNLADAGIFQVSPVDPESHYHISGEAHSDELESANGIRLAVLDYYSNQVIFQSDEVLGSQPWRELGGEFTVPAGTQLVRICFVRSPATGIVRGRIWFDDIRLEKH